MFRNPDILSCLLHVLPWTWKTFPGYFVAVFDSLQRKWILGQQRRCGCPLLVKRCSADWEGRASAALSTLPVPTTAPYSNIFWYFQSKRTSAQGEEILSLCVLGDADAVTTGEAHGRRVHLRVRSVSLTAQTGKHAVLCMEERGLWGPGMQAKPPPGTWGLLRWQLWKVTPWGCVYIRVRWISQNAYTVTL